MSGPEPSPPPALPPGTRLLHIGPHKTGTTSVQSAFHLARRAAEAQGVHYAGPDRHAVVAVQAAIDPSGPRGVGLRRWRRLVEEMDRSKAPRTVLSSEWFADAEPAAIRRIVREAGGERVRVAVTVRSLERVLPSQWQQYVAAGLEAAYEPWLRSVLEAAGGAGAPGDAPAIPTPTFWRRHRHDHLVERWAEVVGREAVTVIVVDDVDHRAVLRSFERLTGLEAGTLVAENDRQNRSLTLPEAEVVRAFNRMLNPEVATPSVRLNLGLYGATAALRARSPRPGEERIETSAWAVERAREIGVEIVEGLRASGVAVIGDLDSLNLSGPAGADRVATAAAPVTHATATTPRDIWLDVASTAALGVLTTAGLARARRTEPGRVRAAGLLRTVSTERLARVVLHRLRRIPATLRRGLRPRGPRAAADPASARAKTALEDDVLRSFEAAVAADGLPASLARNVIRRGVLPEMLRVPQPEPAADGTWGDAAWRDAAAALSVGVVRAAGLLRSRPGRRFPPLTATVETLEVGRVSTGGLALIVARRLLSRVIRRGRRSSGQA